MAPAMSKPERDGHYRAGGNIVGQRRKHSSWMALVAAAKKVTTYFWASEQDGSGEKFCHLLSFVARRRWSGAPT